MAAQTRTQVRTLVAGRLGALSGWTQSRIAYDGFGRDPDSVLHKGYAVGLGETRDRRESGYRGRPAEGLLTDTVVLVAYGYRLVPKDQVASRDLAETAGQELVNQLMAYGAAWPGDLKVRLESVTSEVTASGDWYIGTQSYTVTHTLPLQ